MYTVINNKQDLSTNLIDMSIVGIGSETLFEDDDRFTQIFNDIVLVTSKVNIKKKRPVLKLQSNNCTN